MASSMNDSARGVDRGASQGQESFESDVINMASQSKRYAKLLGEYSTYQEMLSRIASKSSLDRLEEELKNEKTSAERKKALRKEIEQEETRIREQALDATLAYQENMYKKATLAEKAEMAKRTADNLDQYIKSKQKEADIAFAAAQGDKKAQLNIIAEMQDARSRANEITRSQQFQSLKDVRDKLKTFKEDASKGDFSIIGALGKLNGAQIDQIANDAKARADASKAEVKALQKDLEMMEAAGIGPDDPAYQETQAKLMAQQTQMLKDEVGSMAADLTKAFKDSTKEQFEVVESMIADYKGVIEGRLQGSGKTYDDVMDKISSNLSMSPFVKTKDVIEKMREAAEKGYAYNIEQRAFLSTISEKIANTFDAFDSNLTRLIKLQQADTTAARLGMEASLTKFFNNMFQDSSYLKNLSDSVAGAIIDASASLDRNSSAEFEYTVQKWLGALSSLGMSDNSITSIAEGINYIATGNVQSLANNTSLQTLFAMSASNAGLSYSDLLLNGLNSSNTNRLLESMVLYLKEIAENSDNQVVRAAYGDIFNMSMSDMKAISNLTSGDIKNISSNSLSYSGMMSELNNQFLQQFTRTTVGGMMHTLFENATFGLAEDMMSSPGTYAMYKMLGFMEKRNIDIALPFINAFGTGLDLNTSVQDLLNLGIGLSSAMSLAGNLLSGLGSLGGMRLDGWGATEYTQRGSGLTFSTAGVAGGTSGATYVGSGNSTDMKNSSVSSATDDAEETGKITNKNAEDAYNIDDLYKAVIEGSEPFIRTLDPSVYKVLDTDAHYLNVHDAILENVKGNLSGTNYLSVKEIAPLSFKKDLDGFVMQVKASNATDGMLVKITNADALKASVINSVQLAGGTSIKIDEDSLAKGFRTAMGADGGKTTIYQIMSGMYNDGEGIKVNTNTPIQTELSKISHDAANTLANFI